MKQALDGIYKKKQSTQGYGQQQYNYGGYAGATKSYLPENNAQYTIDRSGGAPHGVYNVMFNENGGQTTQQTQPQESPISEGINYWTQLMENMPTSWDWQGGEASPYGIRTPWLAYNWHYDDQGVIVPNDLNNPFAPWNQPGATQTYEDWYGQQQPSSFFKKGAI